MGNYNRIILVGNVVRDPEIRYVKSGSPVTNFTIAVNRRTKQDDSVDYIDVVAWDKLAETSNAYLTKGMASLLRADWRSVATSRKAARNTRQPKSSSRCCRC
jgi:single-strand DNA-binding protein